MKEMNEDELIKMMVGRSLTNIFPPPVCEPDYSKVVFEAKNLTDNDGKLKDVSFQVLKKASRANHSFLELQVFRDMVRRSF